MESVKNSLFPTFGSISQFLKSTDFSKAAILGFAIVIPIFFTIKMGIMEAGFAMAVGAMFASPSDVSGSYRLKIRGILLSILLASTISLLGGYLNFENWALLPVLGLLMFAISYISVFGFRSSLISFSGMFALVLSFANVSDSMEPYERSLWIAIGGLGYLMLSVLYQQINPKGQTEQYLGKAITLTAAFLKLRGQIFGRKSNRDKLQKKIFKIQSELTETHETLREILIASHPTSGNSDYEGKRLLVFAQLVDMLELAMSNPINYEKTDSLLAQYPEQEKVFQDLIFEMVIRLNQIAAHLNKMNKLPKSNSLLQFLKEAQADISIFPENETVFDEVMIVLQNLYKYQEKQVEKIQKIEWLLRNPDPREVNFIKREDASPYVTKQDYNFKILWDNFNFGSAIFKHSLRLAVIVIIGFMVGSYFSVQNPYWILLTIIVIMRPNYGLTKTRSAHRVIGTLLGGVLAVGIVLLTQNLVVYGVLAIVSLVIGFSMVQKNYKASATFITISVVFVYALLRPDVYEVIQFRITDTLIGAGLATLGNIFLWPAWEIMSLQKTFIESIKANQAFLKEIVLFYQTKGEISPVYKVSRKKAFLALANLSAAFQRMTQEPKSRQKNLDDVYKLVALNHTFLSSLASCSAYIQNHPTTEASENFQTVTNHILKNMENAIQILLSNEMASSVSKENQKESNIFEVTFGNNINVSDLQINATEEAMLLKLEEAHLIREQLKWLLGISEKMVKLLSEMKF